MYQLAFCHNYDGWILLYFISFFMLATYVVLNILVAFIIDVYTGLDDTVKAEQEQALKNERVEDENK